ncbi:NAD(P)-dependent alcohol dehydrogenase [Phytoactinopolyspora alkaliphila]|uniref:NAD(P)-dependent alcohol dehydrogenase n=1 Tax=Phytoactinopolyspora alkaliphila TaxID=1783498 RepID=A0A6N9YPN5_9ACTN|nr:NAD(P)-dependent alcohol dehydrogenase [Phytoactinopolyspora alkaliphila]NED97021.1 NAD(P)-dependent alcohol dehydrogenase [Phytoactinopolyspora alkaliphila]
MQAAVVHKYGAPDAVNVVDVPQPKPGTGDVLVRVRAAAVTSADSRVRAARFPSGFALFARLAFGVLRPRRAILGSAFSGEVAAVGAGVSGFSPSDEVCGMTGTKLGAHAEYVVVPAKKLARVPAGVSHEDAAGLLFGGTTALYFLRDKAVVKPGMSVLVNGASGAVGTSAVQLAKHLGATVTGVTSSSNAALVTTLGAERVIDYTAHDVATVTDQFDAVLDTVGNLSIASGRRLLNDDGVLVLAVAGLGELVRARGKVIAGAAPERVEDFEFLLRLVADGEFTVVLDQVYGLHDVAAAHRRVDSGRKVGNIVVRP